MRKRVDIYYFSGTGNTKIMVDAMVDELSVHGHEVALLRIETSDPSAINSEHTIGLAFPVAMGTTYPLVWRFVEGLPEVDGTEVFMLDTKGAFSFGVKAALKKELLDKGYNPIGAGEITTPDNLFVGEKNVNHDATLLKGQRKAKQYAVDLMEDNTHWGGMTILARAWNRFLLSDLAWSSLRNIFTVNTKTCNGCGTCARLCPVKNIVIKDGVAEFSDHCETCIRCYAYCPQQAIKRKKDKKPYRALEMEELLRETHRC